MKKIIFTGGAGRFANVFRSIKNRYKIEYPKIDFAFFASNLFFLNL